MSHSTLDILLIILKIVGIAVGCVSGVLGTVMRTHRGSGANRRMTGWGRTSLIITICGALLAAGAQVVDSLRQYRDTQARQRADSQKDTDYHEQLNRILAGQNASIQKQAQANVASKMDLIEPETASWLSDSNSFAKKRIAFATTEAERAAKEAEESSRKSNQVYEDFLFSLEYLKKQVREIQKTTGENIEISTNTLPDNLCTTPFQFEIQFKKSAALWKVYSRTETLSVDHGFPWLSIVFSDYDGHHTAGINLQTNPLTDSFSISYEERGERLIDESGKLSGFQATARKVIERAVQAQYFLTSPPP